MFAINGEDRESLFNKICKDMNNLLSCQLQYLNFSQVRVSNENNFKIYLSDLKIKRFLAFEEKLKYCILLKHWIKIFLQHFL